MACRIISVGVYSLNTNTNLCIQISPESTVIPGYTAIKTVKKIKKKLQQSIS
jgi:hypothetical protein